MSATHAPTEVDPITFEVIKHRLWQINDEQSIAIRTISSSPIVVEGNDFNVGLFSEDGQVTTAGIGSLVHVGTIGDALRAIMRGAGRIRDGDIFLTNDPFLGALHQNDVVLASPLFYNGEIVMWVGNVLHHPDVGGIDEGSFCINARNLYQDPPRYFFKLVDEGELSPELEHTFVTNSRLPDMVALDLRAQIGAINAAKTRLIALLDERGAPTVRAVMRHSLDLAERQLRDRIRRLPNGAWTGEAWMDGDRVGSERLHRVVVRLTREGDMLHFDFTGSSPQVDAAVNCTYHATVAGAAVPIYTFLCQGDVDWNDGVKRCLKVTAPPGTVVNATFPAPVSICTIGFRWLVTVAASQAVAKMLDASADFRDRVCPSWSVSANCNNLFGVDAEGKRVGALLSDHRGGGAAARSFADGFSHSGQTTSFSASMANVESQEWKLPLLYLHRRQLADSGGAGRWRGGLTAAVALTPLGVPEMVLKSTNTAGTEPSNAHGIDGGYPGAGSQVRLLHGTRVWQELARGRMPRTDDEFGGEVEHLPSKASETLRRGDVLAFFAPGGGGFGDPLDREPARVADDVVNGWVSRERARATYGVALDPDGAVDVAATATLRAGIRAARKQRPPAPWRSDDYCEHPDGAHDAPWRAAENIDLAADGTLHCRRCGAPLSGADGHIAVGERPLHAASPWMALRHRGDGPNFVLEEVSCPSCATLLRVREVRRNGGKG
ncbi:MAG: hydantoinase B/oxoprolinase family protein [Hyphomicrobiales bacterium]|nr:hydantoinase B/oxoprolinase family protein [Hyphomicrobiales bacterium]